MVLNTQEQLKRKTLWRGVLMCTMCAMSTLETQAGYISLIEGVKETILMKVVIDELEIAQACVKMHLDNQSVTHLANHDRTKHIDIRFNFAKDMIKSKEIVVKNCFGRKYGGCVHQVTT